MARHRLFRHLLFAAVGLVVGFVALAIAIPVEPQLLPWVIALFSPGLKLAELILPETHRSMAWTFGWFLRIAILANAAFYYAICFLLVSVVSRRVAE